MRGACARSAVNANTMGDKQPTCNIKIKSSRHVIGKRFRNVSHLPPGKVAPAPGDLPLAMFLTSEREKGPLFSSPLTSDCSLTWICWRTLQNEINKCLQNY